MPIKRTRHVYTTPADEIPNQTATNNMRPTDGNQPRGSRRTAKTSTKSIKSMWNQTKLCGDVLQANTHQTQNPCCAESAGLPKHNNALHDNFVDVQLALEAVVHALGVYANNGIYKFYHALVQEPVESQPGVTLGDLQPCGDHREAPHNGRFKRRTLLACPNCGPWLQAMAKAHTTGKVTELNVRAWRCSGRSFMSGKRCLLTRHMATAPGDASSARLLDRYSPRCLQHCSGLYASRKSREHGES